MNADGSDQEELVDMAGDDFSPEWSPDGTRIVFVSRKIQGGSQICIMNMDDSSLLILTDGRSNDVDPSWSPDGNWIVFSSDRDETYGLYIVSATNPGSASPFLTRSPSDREWRPIWLPEGFITTGD